MEFFLLKSLKRKKFKKSSAAKNSVLLLQSLGKTNPVGNGHVAALHSLTPLNNFLLLVQYIHSNGNLLIRTMWYRIYRKRERINVSLNVSSKMNRFYFCCQSFHNPFFQEMHESFCSKSSPFPFPDRRSLAVYISV